MKDIRVLPLGKDDSAAIVYAVEARRGDTASLALITSVWRRDKGGRYEMVVHQQTPV